MVRFDAYTATTTAVRYDDAITLAGQHMQPGDSSAIRPGYHGFEHKWVCKGQDGAEAIAVLWGGRQRDRIMVEAKGERTPAVVQTLRAKVEEHRCTRVDSCADFDEPGVWDRTLADVLAEHNVDANAFIDTAVTQAQERLNQAVANGRITQEEADARLEQLRQTLTERIIEVGI